MQAELKGKQRLCPACHTEASRNALYCRICGERLKICGERLEQSEMLQQRESQNNPTGGKRVGFCSTCGAENYPGEIFCSHCGVQLPPVASHPPPLPSRKTKKAC